MNRELKIPGIFVNLFLSRAERMMVTEETYQGEKEWNEMTYFIRQKIILKHGYICQIEPFLTSISIFTVRLRKANDISPL